MKKYILLLLVFVATITSCTNDDITISYSTNFKINPATVIAPFTWEWQSGDLESFDTDYQLRARLLIYNSDGLLKNEDTQYFSNYSVVMNSSIMLPDGTYTAIVITDIIGKASNTVAEYWTLSKYENLAETHIDDAGYIGGQNKILGISKEVFTINGKNQNDIKINVQPVGAIFFVWYRNIHQFNDVERYSLVCAKTAESCLFSKDGNYSIAAENNNGSYDWRISYLEVNDYPKYDGIYNYLYVLPVSNLNVKFQALTTSDTYLNLSDVITINPKAGDEWAFILNLADEENNGMITTTYDIVNNTRAAKSLLPCEFSTFDLGNNAKANNQTLFLRDLK